MNGRFEFYNEYVQFNKCINVLRFNLVLLIRLVMPQPHTCQQNGVAKQKYHYFLDVIRTLLFNMQVLNTWGDVVWTAYHLIISLSYKGDGMQ